MTMHRRMPVEGAIEDGRLLSRQFDIVCATEDDSYVVGILLLNTRECHFCEFSKRALKSHLCFPSGFRDFMEASQKGPVEGAYSRLRFYGPFWWRC